MIAMGGDDVAGVAADEEFTGVCLHQQIGNDAAVGTGHEQRAGLLAAGEAAEVVFVIGIDFRPEFLVAGYEFAHGVFLVGGSVRGNAVAWGQALDAGSGKREGRRKQKRDAAEAKVAHLKGEGTHSSQYIWPTLRNLFGA